jgi:hypothetical protein
VGGRGCGDEYEDDAVERERQFPDAGAIDLELPSGMSSWEEPHLTGNSSFDEKIPLKGLKDKPKRAAINYYDDVLAPQTKSRQIANRE